MHSFKSYDIRNKVIWHKAASPPHTDASVVFVMTAGANVYPSKANTKCFLAPSQVHVPNTISSHYYGRPM